MMEQMVNEKEFEVQTKKCERSRNRIEKGITSSFQGINYFATHSLRVNTFTPNLIGGKTDGKKEKDNRSTHYPRETSYTTSTSWT